MKIPWRARDFFPAYRLTLLRCCLLVLSFYGTTWAQSTAEYAEGTSTASTSTASQPNQPKTNARAGAPNAAADPSRTPAVYVVNRKALEQRAGKNPCKLLLRSIPSAAQVYVDGALVGESPLLLFVPAGKYQIEMRGHRLEFGERVVDLLPRETREVALSLSSRYPTRITVH